MKKVLALLAALLITAGVIAQSPEKMSYQAVIRNSSNALITNTQIGMEINIHQGSPTGTIVYTETQTPTTNANGLVSIEIGGATGFNTIDWANGPYFIETKTATTPPLTTYTITGTTQLLSVPYALHAKTADNGFSGNYNDLTNKPILFNGNYDSLSNKPNIRDTVTTYGFSGNYNDLTNKPTTDGSETKIIAGYGIIISGIGTTASPYNVSTPVPLVIIPLAIGDSYQGGIIFWIDNTGEHGLIAATADQSTGIQWYNGTYRYTCTSGAGLYAGAMNTTMIIATQMADNQTGNFAAKVCADYSVTDNGVTYGDWYLPSKYELNLLYVQKNAVGGFASNFYWSSSEYGANLAWVQGFDNGYQNYGLKGTTYYVRAVRAF